MNEKNDFFHWVFTGKTGLFFGLGAWTGVHSNDPFFVEISSYLIIAMSVILLLIDEGKNNEN